MNEHSGINLYSESSLHAAIKESLAAPGDRIESVVSGKVVDLVKADGELVEVQTANLGKIKDKVLWFAAQGRRVRVVYPVPTETIIRRLDPGTGELVSSRRSPKRCDLYSVFDELVNAPSLIAAPRVSLQILLTRVADTKVRDGKGSWWRKGDTRLDRELLEIMSSRLLRTRGDWLGLIPRRLAEPWSSVALGEKLGIKPERARKILYCLARAGLLAECGREGLRKLYCKKARGAAAHE